jgi:hypothetical protein
MKNEEKPHISMGRSPDGEAHHGTTRTRQDNPLLFHKYTLTKGMKESDISFDDRTYVKLNIVKDAEVEPVCSKAI